MPADQASTISIGTVQPRGIAHDAPLEKQTRDVLRAIWAEVLGVKPETVADNADFFTQLAGSSLQVLSIMERVQVVAGPEELPQDIFFGEQTVERQARILLAAGRRLT